MFVFKAFIHVKLASADELNIQYKKNQEHEETMNDAAMRHVGDSKLMVTKEVDKVEKDDYVKHKGYCINAQRL